MYINKTARKRFILVPGAVICVAMMIIGAYNMIKVLSEYNAGAQVYKKLTRFADVTAGPGAAGSGVGASGTAAAASAAGDNMISDDSASFAADFDELSAINPDIVGWLVCDGTVINYPIAQGSDNAYYLSHMFNRERNRAGCLFVDANNTPGFVDRNTIIYGHNMKSKTMFAPIVEYKKQSFYDEHPQMHLSTPDGNYTIELFAGLLAAPDDTIWQLSFTDDNSFDQWLRRTKSESTFKSNVDVHPSDRCVTLSTCSYEFENAKYVLVGKLVPID